MSRIETATGGIFKITSLNRDPWGSPYALDENERESSPTDCRYDTILSAGPNGLWEAGGNDDLGYIIPWSKICP